MNPVEFQNTARDLSGKANCSAADARTAISRGYYAAYLSVRDFLGTELGIKVRMGALGEHQGLQRLLINCQVEEAVAVGHLLANLHNRRKAADYDMGDATVEDAQPPNSLWIKSDSPSTNSPSATRPNFSPASPPESLNTAGLSKAHKPHFPRWLTLPPTPLRVHK